MYIYIHVYIYIYGGLGLRVPARLQPRVLSFRYRTQLAAWQSSTPPVCLQQMRGTPASQLTVG